MKLKLIVYEALHYALTNFGDSLELSIKLLGINVS